MERLRAGALVDMLTMKAFSDALTHTEREQDWDKLPKTPAYELAQDFITEEIKARLQAARARA